jgi:hypothetical protein
MGVEKGEMVCVRICLPLCGFLHSLGVCFSFAIARSLGG